MDSLTRRVFLERLSALAAGGILASNAPAALAQGASEPHIIFPTRPRDRIAIPSYPFRAYIVSPDNRERDDDLPAMNLLDFPAHVAEKFDVHNIEPLSTHFTSTEPDYLDDFRQIMHKTKVHPVNIAVGASHSFYDADAPDARDGGRFRKEWVDVAVRIGSPGIRTHIAATKNSSPNAGRCSESLRAVADYAAERNIVVTLENDDLVSEDAFFIVKVIEAVRPPLSSRVAGFCEFHDERRRGLQLSRAAGDVPACLQHLPRQGWRDGR